MTDCPQNTCHHWYAADQDCTRLAEPHEDMCAEHLDRQTYQWSQFHDPAECCLEHCDMTHEETTMEARELSDDQIKGRTLEVLSAHQKIRGYLKDAEEADSQGKGLDEIYKAFEDMQTQARRALDSLGELMAHEEYHRIEQQREAA